MESDDIRDQLRQIERAEASPYVDQRRSPWWFAPGFAAWFGAMAAVQSFHWSGLSSSSMWTALLMLAVVLPLAALLGAYMSWHQSYHGAWPRTFGPKPPEIRRVYWYYSIGFLLGAAGLVALAFVVPWWVTGLATTAVAYVGLLAYERVYERAADAVKARLA
ncbi:hypothetical protein RDV89_19145 [Nocardioides zeae]|uniref:Transmembrane protein n=1 Tax=Nocardioides imazamoxiresistens TaxID=3231893 RepID=A0ABU3Q2E7_9ACTN|nr:hypothetical protein [Nocardioides zeae]MDT9595212.1 hypothetical protein [Nocardioides zeae]